MYAGLFSSRAMVTAEVFTEGEEFSCDFILEEASLQVVRICRKWISHDPFVGTAMGYVLLTADQTDVDMGVLSQTLEAGQILGSTRALCMADFILVAGKPVSLEMAPRPGRGLHSFSAEKSPGPAVCLGLSMDFAAGKPVKWTR